MANQSTERNTKQTVFREIVFGTLVYAVVLGFFNDYTDILETKSYSITFSVAIVMQILTFFTFELKKNVVRILKKQSWKYVNSLIAFCIWLIMFFSKFIFLAVIDFIFGDLVEISGFIGLLVIILVMTICKELIDYIYEKLGD